MYELYEYRIIPNSDQKEPVHLSHYDSFSQMAEAIRQHLVERCLLPTDPIPEFSYSCDGNTLHVFPKERLRDLLATINIPFDWLPKWIDCTIQMPPVNTHVICLLKNRENKEIIAEGWVYPILEPQYKGKKRLFSSITDWILLDLQGHPINHNSLRCKVKSWMPKPLPTLPTPE